MLEGRRSVPAPPAAPGPLAAAGARAARQSARRRRLRERIHARVVHPIDVPRLVRDPLVRRESRVLSTLSGLRLLLGALCLHLVILACFAAASRLVGEARPHRPPERIAVRIAQAPPEPIDPPSVDVTEPERGPVAEDFPPPPAALPRPEPAPPRSARAEPPAPVTDEPPVAAETEPAPPESAAAPAPRPLFGLSLESTVTGDGPVFATGNSRMGRAPTTAAAGEGDGVGPGQPSPGGLPVAPSPRVAEGGARAASRIPTRGETFEKPRRVQMREPEYPATLRAQGIEGDVLVRVHIDAAGAVTEVAVLRGSGHSEFDRAAEAAARLERFSPATRDGRPVPFTLTYSYRFRIED